MTKPLFIISSSEKGKHCDFFPPGSIHANQEKIHSFCEVKELPPEMEQKQCTYCTKSYHAEVPFITPNQRGDTEMCLNCYAKRYTVDHHNYYQAVRAMVMWEMKFNAPIKSKETDVFQEALSFLKDHELTKDWVNTMEKAYTMDLPCMVAQVLCDFASSRSKEQHLIPEEADKAGTADKTKTNHLNYITQKTKIWAEINYLEAGYKRLNEQIKVLEKDKKDMVNVIKQNLADLQTLHENNSHYE